ncbi:unnamed protein product, partial [Ectocarpus sp. 12 AP-2014]
HRSGWHFERDPKKTARRTSQVQVILISSCRSRFFFFGRCARWGVRGGFFFVFSRQIYLLSLPGYNEVIYQVKLEIRRLLVKCRSGRLLVGFEKKGLFVCAK